MAPSGDGWLIISDRPVAVAMPDTLAVGVFVAEFTLPLPDTATLLCDMATQEGGERGFSLFYQPEVGLMLRNRQGARLVRHLVPGRLPDSPGTARLTLGFDTLADTWQMRLEVVEGPAMPARTARGADPLPLCPGDIGLLSAEPHRQRRHPAVLWFGLAQGTVPPVRVAWIGLRSPVQTPRGPVAAGRLQPGDLVMTEDDGPQPLLSLRRMALPACGSFAPVLLRAPFLPSQHDLLVSSDQRVLMRGPEVEYLFGEDEVLICAAALIDGRTALDEQRRMIAPSVALLFERPQILNVDSCGLLAALPEDQPPRRCLLDYEAQMLMTQLGRGAARRRA
ncbi:Hint domain-containing protein [Fuscibacter oryzae]|uniref:Hint domain-containing protein n=1 Tax=Fuscibacter oryzae TaxID=2803939 RepID=A0A8J7SWP5_9RHOB|nr:Hint domain-containing protein [Fuscibacter oryzae]MBL4929154.1 Hint domain-containing protein [Fuscibacter oryzae]